MFMKLRALSHTQGEAKHKLWYTITAFCSAARTMSGSTLTYQIENITNYLWENCIVVWFVLISVRPSFAKHCACILFVGGSFVSGSLKNVASCPRSYRVIMMQCWTWHVVLYTFCGYAIACSACEVQRV